MNPDDLIKEAMGGAGKQIGGPELFVLEGHPERNELRVLTAEEAFKNNMAAFSFSLMTGFVFMGMFTTKEAAEESMETIRRLLRDEEGNRPG
jgi:hypothetical protein